MSRDEEINILITEAIEKIELVLEKISNSPKEIRKLYPIGTIGRASGLLSEFQESIFQRNPEFKPPISKDNTQNTKMTNEQKEFINHISKEKLQEIDNTILSLVKDDYVKVARVIADIYSNRDMHIDGVNDILYLERIKLMVKKGLLEAQGDLNSIRFSEIKLSQKSKNGKS